MKMIWSKHHDTSQRLAICAEIKLKKAQCLYRQAAEYEQRAFMALPKSKARGRGITAVSAASLLFKSGELRSAKSFASQCLDEEDLPDFAKAQLTEILNTQ